VKEGGINLILPFWLAHERIPSLTRKNMPYPIEGTRSFELRTSDEDADVLNDELIYRLLRMDGVSAVSHTTTATSLEVYADQVDIVRVRIRRQSNHSRRTTSIARHIRIVSAS